jgi:hypothetical protein
VVLIIPIWAIVDAASQRAAFFEAIRSMKVTSQVQRPKLKLASRDQLT